MGTASGLRSGPPARLETTQNPRVFKLVPWPRLGQPTELTPPTQQAPSLATSGYGGERRFCRWVVYDGKEKVCCLVEDNSDG